jgi:ubiquinone/menaquinone biosynthesis C-methylase UbiE
LDQGAQALSVDLSPKAQKTAVRYQGATAREYEARRSGKPKWKAENRVIDAMLARMPHGLRVLDCPVGTGRFLPLYAAKQFTVTGIDINEDMLAVARRKGPFENVELRCGSIFSLDMPDNSFELALVIRIVNLIKPTDMQAAIREVQRVTCGSIILNVRTGDVRPGHFHDPQKIEDIEAALLPGWRIAENVEIHEPDFRMLRLAVA